MYCRTTGINYPLTTPPDDACVFLWQVNAPNRIRLVPAHRCDWSAYTPTQWHVLVFSQARVFLKEAPMIRPMPVHQHGDHDNHDPPRPPGPPDHAMPQAPRNPPDQPRPPDVPMPQAAPAAPAHVSGQPGIHPDTSHATRATTCAVNSFSASSTDSCCTDSTKRFTTSTTTGR